MRIKLDSLAADAIDLELSDDPAQPRSASLRELRQLAGCVHRTANRLHLRPVEARDVDVTALEWSWSSGHVVLGAPGHVSGVEIDADIGPKRPGGTKLDGRASIANITGGKLGITLNGRRILVDKLTLDRAAMDDGRDGGHAALGILSAAGVEVMLGGTVIAATSLTAERTRARWENGLVIEVGSLRIEGLRIESDNLRIDVPLVQAPNGAGFRNGAIEFSDVVSDSLLLVIRDVLGFKGKEDTASEQPAAQTQQEPPASKAVDAPTADEPPASAPTSEPPPRRPLFDMRMLDQLDGRLDVDLTADLSVPVLGSRRATHHFRVPIRHGAIDYKKLEGDLSTLEDAIIDFTVRGDKLALERAVPLLPGLNKPIVVWPLTEVELALAKRKLVRLRTLPNAKLVAGTKKKSSDGAKPGDGGKASESKPSVAVRELDFANLEVDIALRPRRVDEEESEPLAGAFTAGSIGSMRVAGRLRHIPNRALDPTLLELAAEQVQATVEGMFIGGRATLCIADGVIGAVQDATLRFEQLQPHRLGLTLADIRLSGVSIPLGLDPAAT